METQVIIKPLNSWIRNPGSETKIIIIFWEQTVIDSDQTKKETHTASFPWSRNKTAEDMTEENLIETIKTHHEYQKHFYK